MGAAAYIGRVGGLAVALGVGTALVTGQGVALADDTDAGTTGTTSSSGSDASASEATNTETTSTATTSAPSGGTTTTTTTSGTTATTSGTTSGTVAPGVVSAQTNTGSTGSTESATPPTQAASTETATPEPTTSAPTPTEPTAEPESGSSATRTPEPTATAASSSKHSTATASAKPLAAAVAPATDDATVASDTVAVAAAHAVVAQTDTATPAVTAQVARIADAQPAAAAVPAPPNPLQAVTELVSNVVNWVLGPLTGAGAPGTPAQPPTLWTLLAFARREIDNFVAAVTGGVATNPVAAVQTTSLALAAPLAAAAVSTVPRPGFPTPGQQLSPSTSFVDWVTGNYLPNDTYSRFGIWGTDVGTMWDNGIADDPTTPINEHQVLIAFGDTFGGPNMTGTWRFNTLFRSSDIALADGLSVPDGQWLTGNMFGGSPLSGPTYSRQIILPERLPAGLPAGVTLIPTAGISVPTPGTKYGATQYLSFMSVKQWGAAGQWTTNYSAMAYSTDNGENWYVAPSSVRYNDTFSGNNKFQQAALVRPGDGYVYMYGTPNGRQGAAYVSRVVEKDILDNAKYEYYSAGTAGGWFGWGATPAGWYKNNPAAATVAFGQDQGACGIGNPGNQVSEMSVQYNKQLKKYVVLYGDQFNNIVMRTSDTPQAGWSSAKVLMGQQNGGIYAPMLHPWSPSTMGTGTDLYWNLSLWSQYNVMLMKTDLTKV